MLQVALISLHRQGDSDPPSKGASPFSPMGDITVDPKGVAKLLDELHVFFFFLQNSKTALPDQCNDQNFIVSVLYERKKSSDPHVFEMLQAQDLLVSFVHFCDTGCYLIKKEVHAGNKCMNSQSPIRGSRIFFGGGGGGGLPENNPDIFLVLNFNQV